MPAYDLVGNRHFIDETSLQEDGSVVTRNLEYEYDAGGFRGHRPQ